MDVLGARCHACHKEWSLSETLYDCPACHANLDICYDYESLKKKVSRETFRQHSQFSLWRYLPLLPIQKLPSMTLQIGWTPLYPGGSVHGVNLYLKDDGRNPSGSFKDRASALVLAVAQERGMTQVIAASTGNAGSSLACLGTHANMATMVFLPHTAPIAKVTQLAVFGARLFMVNGSYDDAYDLCLAASQRWGWYNRNTGYNPFTREGKKTCAYEICEQLAWRVPDWVVVSVGDGNILSGLWKGFRDLYHLNLIDRLPRLAGVQSSQSNAVAATIQRFEAGERPLHVQPVQATTLADSISVDIPRDGNMAAQAILDSQGVAVEVPDQAIRDSICTVAQRWGIFGEPAAVASYAGFEKLCQLGEIRSGETAVCVITGNGLKDVAAASSIVQDAVIRIDPDIDSLHEHLNNHAIL